jgi:putative flavoprotein involved in K+ transport
VVGAGASGLAAAAALRRRGREPLVLDADETVGGTWARRYDRLCLHTVRRFSGLPFHPIPRSYPRYVPKDLYARYLAAYAQQAGLEVRLGERVDAIRREGAGWVVATAARSHRARAVVVATGRHNRPYVPDWPGFDDFQGRLLHSESYRSGREFIGARVLVVGIGNSGAEIAADLVESGALRVAIAVRSTPPISSREIAGVPVQLFGLTLYAFPPRAVDRVGAALRRIGTGDLRTYGLGREAWGPFAARRPPVIDVGFLKQLKARRIDVLPEVIGLRRDSVVFAGGEEHEFDAVVAATGYTSGLERLIDLRGVLDARGYPAANGAAPPGLFFAGYAETPRGQLFEANRGARPLAVSVDRYLAEAA